MELNFGCQGELEGAAASNSGGLLGDLAEARGGIYWMNIIVGIIIMDQCDTKIDLIKYM